jgi:hypothetical protein
MKADAVPIPLTSIPLFPRWLASVAVALGTLGVLLAIGTVAAIAAGWVGVPRGEQLAGMLVTLGASLLSFVLAWWLRRACVRAKSLFAHVQRGSPRPVFLVLLMLAGCFLLASLAAGAWWGWGERQMAMLVVDAAVVAATASGLEAVRRRLHQQAVAVFAVYAEGALDPADARAIDAERASDPAFDQALREYVRINALVREQVRIEA